MTRMNFEHVVRDIDRRLGRVEQILPTLATKDDLAAAVAPTATKAELEAAIAPLATKEELRGAIAPLATRAELQALGDRLDTRITTENERLWTRTQVLFESLDDHIRVVAEGVASLQTTLEAPVRPMLTDHERRITTLEDERGPARIRRRR